jgi:hypothetical protein
MTNGSGAPERIAMRMIGPAALAFMLLSYPWLAPALQGRFVLGAPLVMVYFFVVWALCIALVASMRADA